jgi:hypothetical protein
MKEQLSDVYQLRYIAQDDSRRASGYCVLAFKNNLSHTAEDKDNDR